MLGTNLQYLGHKFTLGNKSYEVWNICGFSLFVQQTDRTKEYIYIEKGTNSDKMLLFRYFLGVE